MKLNVFKVLESENRIPCIDIFRSLAIIAVVITHFGEFLPLGYVGVDLFFVISGFLVGSILIRKFRKGQKINFWEFFLRRGLKIWPSYYWYLLAGSALIFILYRHDHPDFMIHSGKELMRYLFFYENYTGPPYRPPFFPIWSLCVEEHFYILLPIFFIVIVRLFGFHNRALYVGITGIIVAGILFKILSLYITNSKDTYGGTHVRIDALGWGVLLGLIMSEFEEKLRSIKWLPVLFLAGLLLFAANVFIFIHQDNYFYNKVVFHSLAPFCFFLMILGVYFKKFSKLKPFRVMAYYSYNWYLWHPMFMWIIAKHFGYTLTGLCIHLVVSFLTAVFFTILIEERFLKLRGVVLTRMFRFSYFRNRY